jgi:hypothetical protein
MSITPEFLEENIKREDGRMGKFESRADKGILVGY